MTDDVNLYRYFGGNPVRYFDLLGLESYQCRRPLAGRPGKNLKNGWDVPWNPFFHQFTCTRNPATGLLVCGGSGPSGNPISSPGQPTTPQTDFYQPNACKKTVGDNKCFEQCMIDEWKKPRPRYGIPFGTDCQEYDEDLNERCRQKCGVK